MDRDQDCAALLLLRSVARVSRLVRAVCFRIRLFKEEGHKNYIAVEYFADVLLLPFTLFAHKVAAAVLNAVDCRQVRLLAGRGLLLKCLRAKQ